MMEIRKYFEPNDNENMTYQNLWDVVKVFLKQNYLALIACNRKQDKCE